MDLISHKKELIDITGLFIESIKFRQPDFVDLIYQKFGPEIKEEGVSFINMAIESENVETLSIVIDKFKITQEAIDLLKSKKEKKEDLIEFVAKNKEFFEYNNVLIIQECIEESRFKVLSRIIKLGYILEDASEEEKLLIYEGANLENIKTLSENGVDLYKTSPNPLYLSVSKSSFEVMQYLVDNGSLISEKSVDKAKSISENGSIEMNDFLYKNRDAFKYTLAETFRHSVINKNYRVLQELFEDKFLLAKLDDDDVECGLSSGSFEMVKFMVDNGVDVRIKNSSSLIYAAKTENLETFKYLIS
ncbi:putative ankyrin repeat protein [Smittium culicis]|uniref:Putative ankyrin repeat protein n=1 Tax=Smittium culicis TaxID=133412 RepID=A0A1R1X0V1_9FUNG|nr:putative ankyrin repeat protein [Smittium culicis]